MPEWWIDGDISADAAGNLYATWDTQTAAGDIGWLTYSGTAGAPGPRRCGSRRTPTTPRTSSSRRAARRAIAYIAWQTSAPAPGYATYLRPFSIQHGWLGPAIKVSAAYGNRRDLAGRHLRHLLAPQRQHEPDLG